MKKSLLFTFLFSSIYIINSFAQKEINLEISLASPEYGYELEIGDTIEVAYSLKNLGPVDLLDTDTLLVGLQSIPTNDIIHENIAVGDSVQNTFIFYMNKGRELHTDSFSNCFYIFHTSDSYVDLDQTNDTACVLFYILGTDPNSISNINSKQQLNFYPNPAQSEIYLNIEDLSNKSFTVGIYSISGSKVWMKAFDNIGSQDQVQIDISELSKGMYFIRLENENISQYGKLFIH